MLLGKELLDLQFIETRHKLLDLAAFLDRMDRHAGAGDFRLAALKQCLPLLLENRRDRAAAILDMLSDSSAATAATAPFQGATGAPRPDA
ncbi:MAG: hypothetical protein V4733_07350 [Verrucomicrobiota bacterium]